MKLSTFDALKRIQSKNAVQYVCMEGEILKKISSDLTRNSK